MGRPGNKIAAEVRARMGLGMRLEQERPCTPPKGQRLFPLIELGIQGRNLEKRIMLCFPFLKGYSGCWSENRFQEVKGREEATGIIQGKWSVT